MTSLLALDFEVGPGPIIAGTSGLSDVQGTPQYSVDAKHGVYSVDVDVAGSTSLCRALLDRATTRAWMVVWVKPLSRPNADVPIFQWGDDQTQIGDLVYQANGTVMVRDGVQSTSIVSPVPLVLSEWNRIAVRAIPGSDVGHRLRLYLGTATCDGVAPDYDAVAPATEQGQVASVAFGVGLCLTGEDPTVELRFDTLRVDDLTEPVSNAVNTQLVAIDFDDGVQGAELTAANSGLTSTLGAAPTYDSAAHAGSYCALVSTSTATSFATKVFGSQPQTWTSWYIKLDAYPVAPTYVMRWYDGVGITVGELCVNPDGTVSLGDQNALKLTSNVSLDTSLWNRIAVQCQPGSGSGHVLRLYVGANCDGTTPEYSDVTTATATGRTSVDRVSFGVINAGTIDYRMDRIRVDSAVESR